MEVSYEMARPRKTWADIVRAKGYETGKREGYSIGLAEGLIESMAEGLAKSLTIVLQELIAESLLHCLEKGRSEGFRQALAEFVRFRFGSEIEEKFRDLTRGVESVDDLEKTVRQIAWASDDEKLLESVSKVLEELRSIAEQQKSSSPSN